MARSALRQRPKAFPRQLPSYRAAEHAHFLSTSNESSAREFPTHRFFVYPARCNFRDWAGTRRIHKREHPWTGAAQHALEVRSKTRHPSASFPVLPRSPTLETVSTKQARMLLLDITEARNIDAVRAMPERNLIFVPRDKAGSSAAHTMIHQVVPKLAAGIGKTIGKFCGRGVQQNAGRFQRRSAEEQNTPSEFESLPRLPV